MVLCCEYPYERKHGDSLELERSVTTTTKIYFGVCGF